MRRALCVGIDEYAFGPLDGCVNDASRMCSILSNHADGSPNFSCRPLIAARGEPDKVTRSSLRSHIDELFKYPADVALFHFADHGTVNNLDGYLVTQDAKLFDEGVAMADVLKWANDSPAKEAIILLDCCHAGHLGNAPAIDNKKSTLREGVSILTAARGDQPSVEYGGGGLFTSLVIDALDGGAADLLGTVSAPSIYSFAEAALGAWDQRPLFKAHVASVTALRHCTPPVSRAILRKLPDMFPLPAEDHPLSPDHEKSEFLADSRKIAIFNDLQALARVHLVVPVGAKHMYDAAMASKACRLTPTGRYYWRLASSGKI